MTILFPIGAYYPAPTGGPNYSVYWMAKALHQVGCSVKVVTTSLGLPAEYAIPLGRVLEREDGAVVYFSAPFHYLPFRAICASWQQLGQADVVHLTAIFYPLSWLTFFANRLFFHKPVVWSPRGELDPEALIYSRWKKKPVLTLLRRTLGKNVRFHATCPEEAAYVRQQFGAAAKTVELPNYMELPVLLPLPQKPYLLYLGRIHPKKAIERLIEALALSKSFQVSPYQLLIAGDAQNDYGQQLKKQIELLQLQDRVQFLGQVDGQEKQQLLAQAYFSFMPSHTENFGNVVVEALAQGTPVVAAKGTPWGILPQTGAGYWVENDATTMANTLDELLSLAPDCYQTYRQQARKLAETSFDVHANVEKWVAVYEQAMQG